MEQTPKRPPEENGVRPARNHTYRGGGSRAPENTQVARDALARGQRRKRVKRNRMIGLAVAVLLLAGLVFGIVKLVGYLTREKEQPAQSELGSLVQENVPESTPEPAQEPEENPDDFDYYEAGTPLLLNKDNPLPEDLQGDIEVVEVGIRPETQEMHSLSPRAAAAFLDMVEAAAEDGITLYPVSGYRPHERQVNNYNARVSEYMAEGYDREQAQSLTELLIAVPGTSEHEAGLAIDINSLEQTFEKAEEFTWLQQNCNRFGFILRYEKSTFAITGIEYEPWHYRYVGDNHALAIAELGVTLEEYVELLEGKSTTSGQTTSGTASGATASGAASASGAQPGSSSSDASGPASSSGSGGASSGKKETSEEMPLG